MIIETCFFFRIRKSQLWHDAGESCQRQALRVTPAISNDLVNEQHYLSDSYRLQFMWPRFFEDFLVLYVLFPFVKRHIFGTRMLIRKSNTDFVFDRKFDNYDDANRQSVVQNRKLCKLVSKLR